MQLSKMLLHYTQKAPIEKDVLLEQKYYWQPVTLNIGRIIPELSELFNHSIKALQTTVDGVQWFIVPQVTKSPYLITIEREELDGLESTSLVIIDAVSECRDEEIAKLYYLGALNLCLRSKLIFEQGKHVMCSFTHKLLCNKTPLVGNIYEYNCNTLGLLLRQHQLYDFDWKLKLNKGAKLPNHTKRKG